MTQGNIKILLFLAAVAILGATILYVYKPNVEDKEAIEAEVVTLQARYDELKAQEAHRDEYIAETEANYEKFDERLEYFPAALNQEVSVMFIKGVEKDKGNLQFGVESVGLGAPEAFYTLGGASTTDTTATNEQITLEGAVATIQDGGYVCFEAGFPIKYSGSYEGLKDFIDYIMAYKYRMNISSFDINYDSENDIYSGSIELNAYCVMGGGREGESVDLDVEEGVENPFLGGNGAATVTSSSHDSDNGASIANDHNMTIILNNANNDVSDGIIVSAGSDESYVTSAENSVETLTIAIAEEDGKNMVTYSIGDKSYTMELTSDELCIYVESSERVDSDDKNGVKVNVENDTDISVFIKVSDDDATNPRFTLGGKTGTVKVY